MPAQPAASHTGTATILFTDLVGSTAQRAQLGEEAAEALRRTHDRLLAEAVAAHHGTVAKSVGDGIMATFPGAADAVGGGGGDPAGGRGPQPPRGRRAARRPHRDQPRRRHLGGDRLLRHARDRGGAALRGGRGRADPGRRPRAPDRARSGRHTFTPIGPVALKGLPEPVVACAVAWEPLAPVGIPLPPRLGTRPPFAMFGRGAEAEALALAWAKAKDGQRQVVLLAGEPGIGKTRLATEAARARARRGRHGALRRLRRGRRAAVPALRRGAAPLRHARARARARRARRAPTRRARPPRARAGAARARPARRRRWPRPRPSASCSSRR